MPCSSSKGLAADTLRRSLAPAPQDNSSFVHISNWSDPRTALTSVGILLAAPRGAPNPLNLPEPRVTGCLVAATNASLVPSLLAYAGTVTAAPLLVYVASNVSLGEHPELPATGVLIGRPVVFVGLHSRVTSMDFEMAVN